jgi:hypothetical protein
MEVERCRSQFVRHANLFFAMGSRAIGSIFSADAVHP